MDEKTNPVPSSEERMLSALSHLSMLLFGIGMFVPVLIWYIQRGKSAYVRFQAMQALGYQVAVQLLLMAFGLIVPLGIGLAAAITAILAGISDSSFPEAFIFLPHLLIFGLFFAGGLLYIGLGVAGALYCLSGKNFHYPLVGRWLENYLSAGALDEREDRWLAGLCHASVSPYMFGLLIPLIAWITQKDRSPLLRFQALQALAYQIGGLLMLFLSYALGFIAWFGMILFMVFGSIFFDGRSQQAGPVIGIVFFIGFGLMLLMMLLMSLGAPAYMLLAYWGAFRTLRGRDFRYPLLGSWIAARLQQSPQAAPVAAEGMA